MTVCTQGRECLFGDIAGGEMRLNDAGWMIQKWWHDITVHFPHVELDEFMVMPNHMHGIIVICHDDCRGEVSSPISFSHISKKTPGGETSPLQKRTLGQIVAFFKYQAAKQINLIRNTPGLPVWQRNYYEHIIRSEEELHRIRQYIIENPAKWDNDENNPGNIIT